MDLLTRTTAQCVIENLFFLQQQIIVMVILLNLKRLSTIDVVIGFRKTSNGMREWHCWNSWQWTDMKIRTFRLNTRILICETRRYSAKFFIHKPALCSSSVRSMEIKHIAEDRANIVILKISISLREENWRVFKWRRFFSSHGNFIYFLPKRVFCFLTLEFIICAAWNKSFWGSGPFGNTDRTKKNLVHNVIHFLRKQFFHNISLCDRKRWVISRDWLNLNPK